MGRIVIVFLATCLAACATELPRKPVPQPEPAVGAPIPTASGSVAPPTTSTGDCLIASDEGEHPASVDGVLFAVKGDGATPSLVLRLDRPRCVVGIARASVVTEVYVSTTGPDLRPFVERHIRIKGDVLGGFNDVGGGAVVVLAKEIERLVAATEP